MCARVFEAHCATAPTADATAGRCSPDDSIGNASNYHTELFSDNNDQSHSVTVQVVGDDEVEDLLRNGGNSHTHL